VNLLQSSRLADREAERLGSLLVRRREELSALLAAAQLPLQLLPSEGDGVLAWSRELESARASHALLEPLANALARLGASTPWPELEGPITWDAARAALLERHGRAVDELRALGRRCEEAALRARRLGGTPSPTAVEGLCLVAARAQADELEREVERLRSVRLRDCSAEARQAYAAIRAGAAELLPASVAELLRQGLLRTIEDGR
jgi:hypothetical protein